MVASDDPTSVKGAEVAEGHPQIFLKLAAEKPIIATRWESGVDFMGDRDARELSPCVRREFSGMTL
jgi:hypothetical protein